METVATVLAVIGALAKLEPVFVSTWNNLKPFGELLFKQFSGGDEPTDEERAELDAGIDTLAARLQEPLPPAQPGDPDYVKTV